MCAKCYTNACIYEKKIREYCGAFRVGALCAAVTDQSKP